MNSQGYRFARLLWLYGEIASRGSVTFRQLSESWANATINHNKEPLSHKTFENHRRDVQNLFDINIDCDRSTNSYYISAQPVFDKATQDLLNGALLFNRVKSNPNMCRHIFPEQKSGDDTSKLFTAIDAISESRELFLRYRHNYDRQREQEYHIKPIAVKQFRNRWYIISELSNGETYSFPLDRVLFIKKGEKIEPSHLNIDEMFADAFGIIRDESVKAEEVIIKVEREQSNYFRSLPLHPSQQEISVTADSVTFRLRLAPTYDFIMELLSHGPKVEVLAPQSLRNLMSSTIKEMSKLYNS